MDGLNLALIMVFMVSAVAASFIPNGNVNKEQYFDDQERLNRQNDNSGFPECCLLKDCSDYRGHIAKTESGKDCQPWNSENPHRKKAFFKSKMDSGRLPMLTENFCRNPNGYEKSWCYTMDENMRWEFCKIPMCSTLLMKRLIQRQRPPVPQPPDGCVGAECECPPGTLGIQPFCQPAEHMPVPQPPDGCVGAECQCPPGMLGIQPFCRPAEHMPVPQPPDACVGVECKCPPGMVGIQPFCRPAGPMSVPQPPDACVGVECKCPPGMVGIQPFCRPAEPMSARAENCVEWGKPCTVGKTKCCGTCKRRWFKYACGPKSGFPGQLD